MQLPFQEQCPVPGAVSQTVPYGLGWSWNGEPYLSPHLVGQYEGTSGEDHGIVRWNLVGKVVPRRAGRKPPRRLVALATASPTVRGDVVTLDGSRSHDNIVSYRWQLSRGPDCPSGVSFDSTTVLTGARVSFRAVCSFDATLTVSDGTNTAEKSIAVPVRPRTWKSPFDQTEPSPLNSHLVNGHLQFGKNVCALDGLTGEQSSGHILHRGAGPADRAGFTVGQITDGPFKGTWYVETYTVVVKRAPLVSEDLSPGSDLDRANMGKTHADFVALHQSVTAHEKLHGILIRERLREIDPANEIEAITGTDGEELATQVNLKLVNIEEELTAATSNANVQPRMAHQWNRPATVYIHDGGGGFILRTFPSLAEIGD